MYQNVCVRETMYVMCACVGKECMCVCKSVCAIYLRERDSVCVYLGAHLFRNRKKR